MITSKKIAELAGVSRGTVDRALNNRGNVNEETKKKILEIAELYHYRPNKAGKVLVSQQKNIKIGCIIIKAQNPFYDELNRGILQKAEEYEAYGITVFVKRAEFNGEIQCQCIDELLAMGISALIIQPVTEDILTEKLLQLSERNIPVVTTNTTIAGYTPFCYVGNDFYKCGQTAANMLQLITGSRCNVGIVTGFHKAQSHADRIRGFQDYILDYPGMQLIATEENLDDDFESFMMTNQLLANHPEINSLFLVAGGVYGACQALKRLPPDRRPTVISFDDVPTTRELVLDGTISATICQQPTRQGELSLEILFDYLIDNKIPNSTHIYTETQIKLKSNI